MRIAFAIPGDIDTPTGGYRYDRRILAELRAAGHEVGHVVLNGGFPDPLPEEAEAAIATLAALEADAVLVDGLAFSALPVEGLRSVRAPLVALIHHPLALETGLSPAAAAAHRSRETAALTAAAGVVVTSEPTRDTLLADYAVPPDRIDVAVPGLDPSWFQQRDPSPEGDAVPLIVSVGSIISRKGHDVLLDALGRLMDHPWRAVVIGSKTWDSSLTAALERQISHLGGRASLAGALSEEDIRAHYRAASVFSLATRYEGFGMVFLEAMASGLPVVGTRGGAVPSVVPDSAGLLVDVDDPAALAAALRRVLTEPAFAARLSHGAREAARSATSWAESAALIARRLEAASRAPASHSATPSAAGDGTAPSATPTQTVLS
ncbi:glycosyltransferase [Stappia sp. 22II-S9-Z10]|nr:glycosyltransferase [Stappia sp. 22II-S9-Z10]